MLTETIQTMIDTIQKQRERLAELEAQDNVNTLFICQQQGRIAELGYCLADATIILIGIGHFPDAVRRFEATLKGGGE